MDRGILFRDRLVRRILDREKPKTQTRRIGPQPIEVVTNPGGTFLIFEDAVLDSFNRIERKRRGRELACSWGSRQGVSLRELQRLCPYGQPGDRLYVREAWRTVESLDELAPRRLAETVPVRYEADGAVRGKLREEAGRYRHGRFMPRWASRIDLEITSTRLEQLQAITNEDAIAEGVELGVPLDMLVNGERSKVVYTDARTAFAHLWCSVNGPDAWKSNPWVWVVEFKRIETPRVLTEADVKAALAEGARERRAAERVMKRSPRR